MAIFSFIIFLAILLSLFTLGLYTIFIVIRVIIKCYNDKQLSFWNELPNAVYLWSIPIALIFSFSIYFHFNDGFGILNTNFPDRELEYEFNSTRSFHGDGYSSRIWNVDLNKPTELDILESCPFENEKDDRYEHFCWKPIDNKFYELYSSTKSWSENAEVEKQMDDYIEKSGLKKVWYSFNYLNRNTFISDLELLIYFEKLNKLVYINFNT